MPRALALLLTLLSLGHYCQATATPILEQAQLLSTQQRDGDALGLLWQHIPDLSPPHRSAAILLAAELCQRNGLSELARSYYLHWLTHPEPDGALASGDRLQAGQFFASHQEWNRLRTTLESHWQRFPYLLKSDAFNLLTLADLAQHLPQQTAARFQAQQRTLRTDHLYLQHNRAVALYRQGKTFEARQLLHKLLKRPFHSDEDRRFNEALRVQLASHYLRFQQGKNALPLLDAIKQDSPYATRALLLSGWAELTPDATQPQCSQARSGQVCWIEVDATGRDVQRSPSSISESFALLRQQLNQTNPNKPATQELNHTIGKSIRRWQLAGEARPSQHIAAEQQARLEALVSIGYAQQTLQRYKAARASYKHALAELAAQQQAPDNAAIEQQQQWRLKLAELAQRIEASTTLSDTLKQQALAAIRQAIAHRQSEQQQLRQQLQQQWQQALTEYKKQAHLGLASASHQLSFQ